MATAPAASTAPPAPLPPQAILSQLNRRQLYCYCDEVVVPYEARSVPKPSAADIVDCWTSDGLTQLTADDIVVAETKIDFAQKDQNPLDQVSFFQTGTKQRFHLRSEQVGGARADGWACEQGSARHCAVPLLTAGGQA